MALNPCEPCECIEGNIANDVFKQDVELILCQILTALGYVFPEDACDPCSCVQGNISTDKFKQDVEILLCQILANIGGGGGGSVVSFSFTDANGVDGTVTNPNTTPNLTIDLTDITPDSVAASGTVTGSNLSGTNTGDQTITLTGDVTGSGTGIFAATIANQAVTYAKIQDVTGSRLLGRANAVAGVTEEISLGTGLSFTGTTLNADGSVLAITSLTGDVTGTGPGATATTIANDAVTTVKILDDNVTFAKIQNITTARLLGRATAGSGDMEEITLGTGLAYSGTTLNASFSNSFSGIYSADPFLIAADTADAADTKGIDICGGGAASNTRGGFISLRGNEDAATGAVTISAGLINNIGVTIVGPATTGGFVRLSAGSVASMLFDRDGNVGLTPNTGGSTIFYRTVNSANLVLASGTGSARTNGAVINLESAAAGGAAYFECAAAGTATTQIRNAAVSETNTSVQAIKFVTSTNDRTRWYIMGNGNLVYGNTGSATTENFIQADTADASDTKRLNICGGGASGTTRGALVQISGNENGTTPGDLYLESGNVANADITANVGLSTGSFIMQTATVTNNTFAAAQSTQVNDTITSVHVNKKVQTTDNTTTTLWNLTLADNTTYSMEALVTARRSSTTDDGLMARIFIDVYRNNGGGATFGSLATTSNTSTYGPTVYAVAVDVNSNDVRIRVTGATAETVNWATTVNYVSAT